VPTLVLNGDLDNITPLADARVVASRFPDSTLVVIQNSGHVTALQDQNDCASRIYQHFVRALSGGNTSCASRTPEVRVVPSFPLSLAGVAPASQSPGDRSRPADRRMAAAAADTVADAVQRWWVNYSGTEVGLRGGTWSYTGTSDIVFTFHKAAFVPDVRVSGTASWQYSTGVVRGTVVVRDGRATEHLRLAWSEQARAAVARIDGTAGGRTVRLHMLAP
jgi:hypothetical protein